MSKQQIILTVLGVVLVIALFSLPKIVVKNSDDQARTEAVPSNDSAGAVTNGISTLRRTELSDSDRQKVDYFKEQLKNQNNSSIFADSLAGAYLQYQEPDSVAKYAERMVEADSSLAVKEKAGNYYYEAMGLAGNGATAEKLGNRARQLLSEVMEANPGNLTAKYKIAITYISSSNPMKGIMMLREILEEDPVNKEALYQMGILSVQSGQFDKAVGRLEKLLEVDPSNIQAMFYLGVSYKELGKKEQAKVWLTKAKEKGNDPAVSAAVDTYLQSLK